MNFRYAATVLAGLSLGNAHADDGAGIGLSGFGTVSAVHSSERQADFVGSFFQPNGAGHTRNISLDPDSKLGVQANGKLNDKLSAVVQLVSQHQDDNSYRPRIEWANVKYQLTPELSARAGRIALPAFLVSDSRLVGYSNTFVRPPLEVYGMLPITSNDGVDASYRTAIGGANNTFQAYFGGSTSRLPGDGKAKLKSSWGFNDSVESGAWTVRFAYLSGKTTLDVAGINGLIDGLDQFAAGAAGVPLPAFQAAAAQARGLSQKYRPEGFSTRVATLSALYDPGSWFVSGEVAAQRFGTSFLGGSNGWYLHGGYRFGSLTPYATYAAVRGKTNPEPGISTAGANALAAGAAALNGGINAVIDSFAGTQTTVAAGLRWDFMTNFALKGQYDRISLGNNSSGRFGNVQPGFAPGGKANVVTVAVDFVF